MTDLKTKRAKFRRGTKREESLCEEGLQSSKRATRVVGSSLNFQFKLKCDARKREKIQGKVQKNLVAMRRLTPTAPGFGHFRVRIHFQPTITSFRRLAIEFRLNFVLLVV